MLYRRLYLICPCKLGQKNIIRTITSKLSETKLVDDDFSPFSAVESIELKKQSLLDTCTEDISHVAPFLKPTFNFASYANQSVTLQELLKLGVNLHKLEKKITVPPYILGLDFERDIKNHVVFLHESGITINDIGNLITKNPYIFKQNLDDMQVRINYLGSKKFSRDMIVAILSRNPYWLMFSTQRIDARLGFFQKEFKLSGNEVRSLTVQQPKLITYALSHVKLNTFSIKEEMGFTDEEKKMLLLRKPNLFMKDHKKNLATFEYLHNEMKIPHHIITESPEVLLCRDFRLKQRHMFILKLGKAQYNPREPGYVAISKLVSGTDIEFCDEVAKCPIELYNTFLKTL